MWLTILSDQLPIIAMVGRYPTIKLIGRTPIHERPKAFLKKSCDFSNVFGITSAFALLFRTRGYVKYVLLTGSPL